MQDRIKVGDEVRHKDATWTAVVTFTEHDYMTLLHPNGQSEERHIYDFIRTGRTFPQVIDLLKAMP